jgi:molybdopterin molybdotransferase
LATPGSELSGSQVYESVSPGIISALSELGVTDVATRFSIDERETTALHLKELADHCDVVITVGGASVGAFDFARLATQGLGARPLFKGAAIKPGKPVSFWELGNTAIFGLPGNPLSALITFLLFVAPFIRSGSGGSWQDSSQVTLGESIKKAPGRTEFVPATVVNGIASPNPHRASHMLMGLSTATHLIQFDASGSDFSAGCTVPSFALRWSRCP